MKQIFFMVILAALLTTQQTVAQETNYLQVAVDAGLVVNSAHNEKFGLGGSITWLTQDNLLSLNPDNYFTLGVKAFNNPYGGGKFVSSIMNDVGDAFNYIMPLAGYRVTWGGVSDGFFVEPRMGAAFGANFAGFAFSPIAGYAVKQFNFSLYCDMGFGNKKTAILEKNFFTPGISIAYTISIN